MNYDEMFDRNIGVFSSNEQAVIKGKAVTIIGCGGMGGVTAQVLARTGFENFYIADPDKYETVNINNQFNAFNSTIGQNKAEVVCKMLKEINPNVQVHVYSEGLTEDNLHQLTSQSDVIFDCVDFNELFYSYILCREARRQNKFVFSPQAIGYGGSVLIFDPEGESINEYLNLAEGMQKGDFDSVHINPEKYTRIQLDYIEKKVIDDVVARSIPIPNLALAQTLMASIMVSEALFLLLNKRKPISIPKIISVDVLKNIYNVE